MTNNGKGEDGIPPAAPKRVSGGLVLKAKKKKRRSPNHNNSVTTTGAECSSLPATHGQPRAARPSSGVPSILSSIPSNYEEEQRIAPSEPQQDEFGDDAFDFDVPSDALLCLQSYTRSSTGGMVETCAYAPIFTREGSSHAAPFLAKHVLLHLQNATAQSSSNGHGLSPVAHVEQQIKQLASSNKIRLLQLHGTAPNRSDGGSCGLRGDGNDDEDIAVMETSAYLVAAEMALQNHFQLESATFQRVYSFLENLLLPYFGGKIWFPTMALESFYENAVSKQKPASIEKKFHGAHSIAIQKHCTIPQMKEMVKHLVNAGVLLSRSGVGPSRGLEGYWFSLPGLGKAAKSIVDGRANLVRRLRSSKYKEKKRCVLEHEIGRIKRQDGTKQNKTEQSGKIVLLDLLAKGWVAIHTTCTGEQFVRLTG